MPQSTIDPDATIADVVPTLTHPEKYVREVVSTMFPCQKSHGNARVRIGITGEGKMPFHKISFIDSQGNEQLYGAYSGTSEFQDAQIHVNTWSRAFMTLEDVQTLLGKLRGWKGVTAKPLRP